EFNRQRDPAELAPRLVAAARDDPVAEVDRVEPRLGLDGRADVVGTGAHAPYSRSLPSCAAAWLRRGSLKSSRDRASFHAAWSSRPAGDCVHAHSASRSSPDMTAWRSQPSSSLRRRTTPGASEAGSSGPPYASAASRTA